VTSNDLLLFRANGPGAKLHIPFQVAEDGDYELIAQVAHSLDYGSYAVLLEGPRRHRPCRGSRDSGARTTAQVAQSALGSGFGDQKNPSRTLALGWRWGSEPGPGNSGLPVDDPGRGLLLRIVVKC
jgi:hypothetical protein